MSPRCGTSTSPPTTARTSTSSGKHRPAVRSKAPQTTARRSPAKAEMTSQDRVERRNRNRSGRVSGTSSYCESFLHHHPLVYAYTRGMHSDAERAPHMRADCSSHSWHTSLLGRTTTTRHMAPRAPTSSRTYFGSLPAFTLFFSKLANHMPKQRHRDFWREVPYMLRDLVSHICSAVRPRHSSSRSGYIAV